MKDTKQIPEFHACLFDRLELTDGTTTLSQVRLRSNQLTKLIFYLIVYAETGCTAQQLINLLWDDNSENPANALKNLVYRIRKVLHGIWPDIDFIITRNGFYQWNPKVPIHTDIEEFMEYYNESKKLESTEARTTALESLTDVYKGKVLSDFGDDYDILCRQTYFQNMYLEAVNILSDIYEANEDFATMEQLCQKAILIYPLEESVHCCLLRSYIGEKRFAVAEQHYHDTVQLLNDNLGQEASDELRGKIGRAHV